MCASSEYCDEAGFRRNKLILGKLIIEGIVLGILLFVYCLIGIRNGAVGMVFLYSDEVKKRCVERGMTTWETIRKRATVYRLSGAMIYIAYTLVFVYAINKMRGFWEGFAQMLCCIIERDELPKLPFIKEDV